MSSRHRFSSGILLALSLASTSVTGALELLEPFSGVSEPIRVWLEVRPEGAKEGRRFELWWRNTECWLLRFLEPKDAGKFLGPSDRGLWLVTPSASRPVAVSSRFGLGEGAALSDVLASGLALAYRAGPERRVGGWVELELEAKSPQAPYPKLLWVADATTQLPVRLEFRASSGRALRTLEFRGWLDSRRRIPSEVKVADLHRGGKLVVRFRVWETRELDRAACQPEGTTARAKLPPPLRPAP